MTEQFANNAVTTLNGSIGTLDATITVTSSLLFPTSPQFRLLVDSEIMLVTGVSGNVFTVTRGVEATAAASHLSGAQVSQIITSGSLIQLKADSFTAGGDLSGSNTSQNVIKLRGNSVASQTLGAGQNNYPLVWDNADGYWRAQLLPVQGGGVYGSYVDIRPFAGVTNTASTTFVTAGTFELDTTALTAANGTRTIVLRVIGETTAPQMTIQLYNLTAAAVVTGSTLTTSSVIPVLLTTGDLSANLTNGSAIYQVQIKMAAGGTTDRVTLDMATLRITWS